MSEKNNKFICMMYNDDFATISKSTYPLASVYIQYNEGDKSAGVSLSKENAIALAHHILEITK